MNNLPQNSSLPVLALNSGSSSLKFGLYLVNDSIVETLVSGSVEALETVSSEFLAKDGQGKVILRETAPLAAQDVAVERIARYLVESQAPMPRAIGHRIVHGGTALRHHCCIDRAVMQKLEAATAFAPVHTPAALSVIRGAILHFPGVTHVACFDTCFHAQMPEVAWVLPIPASLRSLGLRRYGFHGLSCESIVEQLGASLPSRTVIAHLGNGASITAVKDGISIDTSMGLTPSGGVMMGTRSGDIDPGLLVYLVRERQFNATMLEELVDHQGGMVGISGVSGDMRQLHEAAVTNADARLAIRMFCYSVRKQIAAMSAVLGGVDLIVFTGGIGENDPIVRAEICSGLSMLGLALDSSRNHPLVNPISGSKSRCAAQVLPSREDDLIARHAWDLARSRRPSE